MLQIKSVGIFCKAHEAVLEEHFSKFYSCGV